MSYINRRPPEPQFACGDPARTLCYSARLTMNRALAAWLNTDPNPAAGDLEADGTVSIIRQLVALARGGTP